MSTFRIVQKYPASSHYPEGWRIIDDNKVHSEAIRTAAAHASINNMAEVGVFHTGSGEWVAYFYPLTDKVMGR